MPVYQTTFAINAPADRVWETLTALHRYPEWNPQIPMASGTLQPGERISLKLALPGRPTMDLTATIEEMRADALLTWRGHLMAPWFFEGYRRFEISPVTAGLVQVTHVEDVHGLLAPLFAVALGSRVQSSHNALNAALKARAETVR
jgi:hypothetical protein